MKYIAILIFMFGCVEFKHEPHCHSSLAKTERNLGLNALLCDRAATPVQLSDGNVMCVCPKDYNRFLSALKEKANEHN